MSQFTVQSITQGPEQFSSAYGVLYSVRMAGILDGQIETNVQINVKDPSRSPVVGSVIDCTVEKRDAYGVKIKKIQIPPQTAYTAPQGPVVNQNPQSPTQATTSSSYPPREDPTTRQASIERQNSLTNAISYCTTKAQALIGAKKYDEALREMEGKKVLQVATYFSSYNSGKVTVVMTPEEVAQCFGYAAPPDESLPEESFTAADYEHDVS